MSVNPSVHDMHALIAVAVEVERHKDSAVHAANQVVALRHCIYFEHIHEVVHKRRQCRQMLQAYRRPSLEICYAFLFDESAFWETFAEIFERPLVFGDEEDVFAVRDRQLPSSHPIDYGIAEEVHVGYLCMRQRISVVRSSETDGNHFVGAVFEQQWQPLVEEALQSFRRRHHCAQLMPKLYVASTIAFVYHALCYGKYDVFDLRTSSIV